MRSPSDPIRTASLHTAVIAVVGGGALTVATIWSLAPIQPVDVDPDWQPSVAQAPEPSPVGQSPELAVFDAQLWTVSEPASVESTPTEVQAAPPPPPPRLQLVGIVTGSDNAIGLRHAIFYDPDADATHIVATGERIGGLSVGDITDRDAEIESASGSHRFVLDTGRSEGNEG